MMAEGPITPLPVILPALPDEVLSSWISRHAAYYEVPPLVLLKHCLPSSRGLRSVDLKLNDGDAVRLARLFRAKPHTIVDMSFAAAPPTAHRMIAIQPIHSCRTCTKGQGTNTAVHRYQLQGWRLTCPLCGQILTDNNGQAPSPPSNRWHHIRHGERLFEAETIGDSIGWASPAELARLLLMRRVPRPLNVDVRDLERLRVLGAVFPDFDEIVVGKEIALPSAGKPILPIDLREYLLAAVAMVTHMGFAMLETLQSHTMGTNRTRFGSFVADMRSCHDGSHLCSNYETDANQSSHD